MSALSKVFKTLFKFSPAIGKAAANAQSEIVEEFLAEKVKKSEDLAEKAGKLLRIPFKKEPSKS